MKKSLLILLFLVFVPALAWAYSPVARTDVVPYQRVEYGSSFKFGVVAFSKPGIDNVSFAIASGTATYNGASPVTSSAMALNTRVASAEYSGVWEYFITISASDFTGNGTFTVTPTVTDNNSNTRVLPAVTMIVEGSSADFNQYEAWVDIEGSDGTGTVDDDTDPFPSIQSAITATQTANGGDSSGNIIYLVEDTYSLTGVSASTSGEWLTITKAASANRNNVIINEGVASITNLKFDNVTLQSTGTGNYIATSSNSPLWTNSCRRIGSGRLTLQSRPISFNKQSNSGIYYYSTDDYTYNVNYAYMTTDLIRGAVVETVGDDAFENFLFVVNTKVDYLDNGCYQTGCDPGCAYAHSDVLQAYQVNEGHVELENRIAYNVFATDAHYQGIMLSTDGIEEGMNDMAFVNVFIEMRENGNDGFSSGGCNKNQMKAGLTQEVGDHILFWHCSFPYSFVRMHDVWTNSSIVGNLFWQLRDTGTSIDATTEYLYNHYMHVYGVTSTCTGTDSDIQNSYPCPHWHAREKDTGSSTSSNGDGVVDISDDTADDFGYPIAGSDLVDALSTTYVPVDVFNNQRDANPDIGALELDSGSTTSIAISASDTSANEIGSATGSVTVTCTNCTATTETVTVTYTGTATEGVDYTDDDADNILQFPDGTTEVVLTITPSGDVNCEGNETVIVTLSNPTGGAVLGNPSSETITITDDFENDCGQPLNFGQNVQYNSGGVELQYNSNGSAWVYSK